jgi:hypothetical protein
MRVLSGEIRNHRWLAGAAGAVAIVAGLHPFRLVAKGSELLTALYERLIPSLQRQERSTGVRIVRCHLRQIIGRQPLGDWRHDSISSGSRREILQLGYKILDRLSGNTWKSAGPIGTAVVSMTLGTGRNTSANALRRDHSASCAVRLARRRFCRKSTTAEADVKDGNGCEAGKRDEAPTAHACTKGPGAFRYLFLIASSAQ